MTEVAATKVFITGACAGLAEVRQALNEHDAVDVVGTAVAPEKAQQKIAASGAHVILHGTARGDRIPVAEIAALREASAAPIILVTSGNADGLLQGAVQAGVHDVVLLPQLTDTLVFAIRKTSQLAVTHAAGQLSAARGKAGQGRLVTVFSPKGGVGKSVIACALATTAARREGRRALLVDLDLQFGDLAIMMGVEPEKTIYDLVMTNGELDTEKLGGYVVRHPGTGVDIIPAPVRPEDAELVSEERVGRLLDVAKEAYDLVVADTSAFFQATTLATLDRTDHMLLVAGLDIPTVKNIKLTLQTLSLLHYPKERINLVLNRSGAKGDLDRREIEKALDLQVAFEVPNDREVCTAVNRGVPMPLVAPRSGVTKAIESMADAFLVGPGDEVRGPRRRSLLRRGGQAPAAAVLPGPVDADRAA